MSCWPEGLSGALVDVDGTLLVGDAAVIGAAEALERLRSRGVAYRLTTNTTRHPRSAVAATLNRSGIQAKIDEILTPAILARRRIVASGRIRAHFLLPESCLEDFEGVEPGTDRPDWLVVGDLGRGFTWERLNAAFLSLREGATFLALQKNRFWKPDGVALAMDAGAYVAALEFASGCVAEVVGKPSATFFELALESLGLPASRALVIGDDPATDGRGGAAAGARVALVRTGKFSEETLAAEAYRPDLVLDSVADL